MFSVQNKGALIRLSGQRPFFMGATQKEVAD